MVYNVWHRAKANPILHYRAGESGNGSHLCQSVCEREPGTGALACDSGHDLGYSMPLCVCLHECSNPSPLPLIPTSLNPSSILRPSYDTSYGISYGNVPYTAHNLTPLSLILPVVLSDLPDQFLLSCLFIPLCCLSLPRNKHTPELAPFDTYPSIIPLMKALRLACINLSITAMRFIDHISPVMIYNTPNQ